MTCQQFVIVSIQYCPPRLATRRLNTRLHWRFCHLLLRLSHFCHYCSQLAPPSGLSTRPEIQSQKLCSLVSSSSSPFSINATAAKLCTTKHFYVASTQWNYFGWWKQEIFKFSTFHLMDHLQLCALCKCGALQSIQPPPTQKNKPDRSGRKWTKYCLKWRRQKQ